MRGTRAASYEKNKLLRAVAAEMNFLHDRGSHIAIDDFSNDYRAFFNTDPEWLGGLVAHALNRAILIQPHLPAEIVFRVEVAEHHVSVCHRRLASAEIETSWAGNRAGSPRTHL